MLEEYDKIDGVGKGPDGTLQLVIMDAGLTDDPDARHSHLIEKLRTYVAYATSASFRDEYPEIRTEDIRILVMCRLPPTERMQGTTSIARADSPESAIPISYRHFPGSDDEPVESSPVTLPSATPPVSNAPVHITFGILFLYLAATRYLLTSERRGGSILSPPHRRSEPRSVTFSSGLLAIGSAPPR